MFGQEMKVCGELAEHGEVVVHSNVVDERDQLARRFIIQASAREVLERHVASEAISRIDVWGPRLGWDFTFEVAGLMEGPARALLNICERSHQTKGIAWVSMNGDRWTSC